MNTNDSNPATVAYKVQLEAVNALLLDTLHQLEVRPETAPRATWGDVGTLAQARELAAQLAWTLGAITAEDAKAKHGVTL